MRDKSRRLLPAKYATPPGWNSWPAAAKIERLTGMSLERCHDYLSWDAHLLSSTDKANQINVMRIILMIAARGANARHEKHLADEFRQMMVTAGAKGLGPEAVGARDSSDELPAADAMRQRTTLDVVPEVS